MDIGALKPADRNVEGVVEMMLDATRQLRTSRSPSERLFGWHAALFPTGRSGMTEDHEPAPGATTAKDRCRLSPVPWDREHVHFEAPKADRA